MIKAVVGASAVAVLGDEAKAASPSASAPANETPRPDIRQMPTKTQEFAPPPAEPGQFVDHANSDVMVDVLKSLDIQYVAANPGSSFRGLHESIVNYGGNKAPQLIQCLHEETAVAIASGYARACGRPMGVMLHATVGIQHGAMSIYHSFCDQTPVLMFAGTSSDAATRRPLIEWIHSAQDEAATARDFLKWDDRPASIQHFAESTVRAVKVATTVPMGPVMITIDTDLQEEPFEGHEPFDVPALGKTSIPVGDPQSIEQVATALANAKAPVILAYRYARTPAAMALLVTLAELLECPVVDTGDRFNFPTDHRLNHSQRQRQLVAQADVVLALEPVDLWGSLNSMRDQVGRPQKRLTQPDARVFTIAASSRPTRSNYQNFQRYIGPTLEIDGDAEASLPFLIEAVRRQLTDTNRAAIAERGASLTSIAEATRERAQAEARVAWDAAPVSTGRLCSDIWDLIEDEDFVLTSLTNSVSYWPQRLWKMNKPHQYVGSIGAAGIGSSIGTSLGAALAHKGSGKIVINIQNDGDLMYAPGALWTAVHHHIPLLTIVHNNRAYHQEIMHIQRMANRRQRGIDRARIGSDLSDPPIDFTRLAASMGMWAADRVERPHDLKPALSRAIAVVKRGEPALVEVLTQPR